MIEFNKKYYINTINYKDNTILLLYILIILIFIYLSIKYYIPNINKELFTTIKKYNFAIMTIFKNEQDYMDEWISHHISQGFDQIYLYCNDPNIHNYKTFNKYTKFIKLIDWVDKKNNGSLTIQRQAYTHCVQTYSNECQFLIMLDLDEFLIPIKSYSKVTDYINSLKSNWNNIKAFKIQRYDFGSNGHINKPSGSVISNYKYHEKICSSYKTMANTDYINKKLTFFGVHDFNFLNTNGYIYNNYFGYHETGFPNSCKSESINEIPLVINHYYTKSYEEYIKRCDIWKDGGINPIGYRTNCEEKFKLRDINEIENY
jgi:hypothetical protein